MKKIWTKIKSFCDSLTGWWLVHFRNTVIEEVELDAYVVTFRKFTMEITTKSGNMKLKTVCMQHPQAFLLHCVSKDDYNAVEWFCNSIYSVVSLLTTDQGLINDFHKAFAKYEKRMNKKAASTAKNISDDEDKMSEEIIKANIAYGEMSKAERIEHQETIKDILHEQ